MFIFALPAALAMAAAAITTGAWQAGHRRAVRWVAGFLALSAAVPWIWLSMPADSVQHDMADAFGVVIWLVTALAMLAGIAIGVLIAWLRGQRRQRHDE